MNGIGSLHQRHSQVGRGLQFHARDDEIAVIEAIRTVRPTVITEISGMSPKYMAGITKGLG